MNTWQEDFKNAIKTKKDLELFLDRSPNHPLDDCDFDLFIPKSFLQKIKNAGENSPLWKQFIPNKNENHSKGLKDPIGDQKFQVTPNLIHRYQNRALFIPTINCPIACRYCFRKNELGNNGEATPFKNDFANTINYLKAHPEINEIIFTGGDPLILSDDKIKYYALEFAALKTIKFLRFHTRTISILPNRITQDFIDTLIELKKEFSQIVLMIHVNHLDELDDEVCDAINRLQSANILLFSQTVLLTDINNDTTSLKNLFLKLGEIGVRPYYLHHPDKAYGTDHFQLDLEAGRKIYGALRRELSGWLIPEYIIDIPNGHGKVSAFNPEGFIFNGELLDMHGELIKI